MRSGLNFSSSASLGLTLVYFKLEVEFEIELYSSLTSVEFFPFQWSMSRPLLGLILLNEKVRNLAFKGNPHRQINDYLSEVNSFSVNLSETEVYIGHPRPIFVVKFPLCHQFEGGILNISIVMTSLICRIVKNQQQQQLKLLLISLAPTF